MFTGIIRPKLAYAVIIWGHRINFKYIKKKFTSLNRLAALATTSTRRSTPTLALEVILNLLPLDLFIEQNALAAWHRQKKVLDKHWRGENKSGKILSHLKHWENIKEKYGITYPNDDSCKELPLEKLYCVNKDSFNAKKQ